MDYYWFWIKHFILKGKEKKKVKLYFGIVVVLFLWAVFSSDLPLHQNGIPALELSKLQLLGVFQNQWMYKSCNSNANMCNAWETGDYTFCDYSYFKRIIIMWDALNFFQSLFAHAQKVIPILLILFQLGREIAWWKLSSLECFFCLSSYWKKCWLKLDMWLFCHSGLKSNRQLTGFFDFVSFNIPWYI